ETARRALVAARPAERCRYRQPPLPVDPVPISPFEHSGLGLFHTFFHFSTPAHPSKTLPSGSEGLGRISGNSVGLFVRCLLSVVRCPFSLVPCVVRRSSGWAPLAYPARRRSVSFDQFVTAKRATD